MSSPHKIAKNTQWFKKRSLIHMTVVSTNVDRLL